MAKCKVCGNRVGGSRTVCAPCEAAGRSPEPELKCSCGRPVYGVLDVCETCWRGQTRTKPDDPMYGALATHNMNGRHVCPCGGTVRPVNTFNGESYYRCDECGATGDRPPVQIEPYRAMSPAEVIEYMTEQSEKLLGRRRRRRSDHDQRSRGPL